METEQQIINNIKEIINHNKFTNDLYFNERAEQNIKLQKVLSILEETVIKSEDKDRESIAEDKKVILNTPHYSIETKETDEGVIIDIFHRHGDLIDTYTYWNDDVMEDKE